MSSNTVYFVASKVHRHSNVRSLRVFPPRRHRGHDWSPNITGPYSKEGHTSSGCMGHGNRKCDLLHDSLYCRYV